MEMIDFRSYDLNTKLLTTAPKSRRLIKGLFARTALFIYTGICVSPYYIPSDKTAPPNSPFCKVLLSKSVIFAKRKIVSPYAIPSDKTAPPDSPFCKVLSAKSVVFPERKITRTALFIYAVICVSPYCIPSDKKSRPDSTFHKKRGFCEKKNRSFYLFVLLRVFPVYWDGLVLPIFW